MEYDSIKKPLVLRPKTFTFSSELAIPLPAFTSFQHAMQEITALFLMLPKPAFPFSYPCQRFTNPFLPCFVGLGIRNPNDVFLAE